MEGILQPATPEGNTHGKLEESIIILGDRDAEHRARRSGSGIESPIPTPFQRSPSPHPIEYTPLLRVNSAPPRLSRMRIVNSPPHRPPFPTQLQSDLSSAPSRGIAGLSSGGSVVGNAGPSMSVAAMGPPLDPVAPLELSANRWVAGSTRRNGSGIDGESPEMVERKVKGLLNKLTMERFNSISDQIIAWANKSEREKDGRTLIQVIMLIFEKATDEATFYEMYARLCRKMMEQINPKVQEDGTKNSEGKTFAGGQLFRKYLLNRCQDDFERGRAATAAAAATKANEDQAVKEANEKIKGGEESELYSEEYYAAAKAKRRGLGLVCFIGELFKLGMLTERIMHECIKKLLANVENPEEEEIESLCKLLTTIGSLLDTQKGRPYLDVYFSRMRELTKNKNVNARMMFMLQVSVIIPLCPCLTRLLSGCHRTPRP